MSKIAIIAALERELRPLVRSWKPATLTHNGRSFPAYQHEDLVALIGGIGCHAAQLAAQAAVAQYAPQMLISAGVAGALMRSLKVGNIITPNVIMNSASGTEYRCDQGGGILVTAGEIAGNTSKQALVEKFHALAVDMEAAAVAEVAKNARIGFRCVKAISDEADFLMPPLQRFVDAEGNFQTSRFLAWAALRPQYWPRVAALARNSKHAAQALCEWLREQLAHGLPPATVVTLERAEFLEAKH